MHGDERAHAVPKWATWVVLGLIGFAHLVFLALDERLPRDLGLYYKSLPAFYGALGDPGLWTQPLKDALIEAGGWYNLFLAACLRLLGRSGEAFRLVDVFWTLAVVGLAARIAGKEGGGWASLATACLAGCFPILVMQGRTGWIHIPEAALVLGAVAAWQADPELARGRTLAAMGLCGALAVAIRPSGMIWVATLATLPWWSWRRYGASNNRVAAILVCWALALPAALRSLDRYILAKIEARDRYAEILPSLLDQLAQQLGPAGLGVTVLGVLAVATLRLRPVTLLCAIWVGLPAALFLAFRAGIDNFTLLACGLAILAGLGFGQRFRAGVGLAAGVFLVCLVPQWLPEPTAQSKTGRYLKQVFGLAVNEDALNYYRPYDEVPARTVLDLIDATCGVERSSCDIAVDQGLFQPFMEEPGRLELFLAQYDDVRIWDVRVPRALLQSIAVDALVQYDCGDAGEQWRARYPLTWDNVLFLARKHRLYTVVDTPVQMGCQLQWSTRSGAIADAGPMPGDYVEGDYDTSLYDLANDPNTVISEPMSPGMVAGGGGDKDDSAGEGPSRTRVKPGGLLRDQAEKPRMQR